jgi:hypothetical protein
MKSKRGLKYDEKKARYDLVSAIGIQYLAEVYTFGGIKYGDRNWQQGIRWGRVFAAIMRHLWAFWCGEDLDKETGLPHTAHAAFGCLALTEYMVTHRRFDDRYKNKKALKWVYEHSRNQSRYPKSPRKCS